MPTASPAGNDAVSYGVLMPARPPLAWVMRLVVAGTPALLASCGPARNEFPPACPRPAIIAEAGDFDRYRGDSPGPHDLTELELHARITGVRGSCVLPGGTNMLSVAISVIVELTRGPAMQGRSTQISYFVTELQGDTIIDKQSLVSPVVFPPNVDRMTLGSGDLNLALPVTSDKTGASYTVLVGFQLTPAEMEANIRRQQH
jgi:hypothetical protein